MISAIRFEGYSLVSQVPSELTAIGAPTRTLWMWLGSAYTVLVAAFGWGVWQSAGVNRAVRIVGGLMLAYGSLGLLSPLPDAPARVLAAGGGTWSGTMHVVLGGETVGLMFLAIGFGAAASGRVSASTPSSAAGAHYVRRPDVRRSSRLGPGRAPPWIRLWERITLPCSLRGRGAGDRAAARPKGPRSRRSGTGPRTAVALSCGLRVVVHSSP